MCLLDKKYPLKRLLLLAIEFLALFFARKEGKIIFFVVLYPCLLPAVVLFSSVELNSLGPLILHIQDHPGSSMSLCLSFFCRFRSTWEEAEKEVVK